MCHAVRCRICSKTTWAGCGQHVNQVMAGVPKTQRCAGHSDAEVAQYRSENSVWKRLFGRG